MKPSALFLAAAGLLIGAGSSSGQSKTGTAVGQFLLIEPSARISAMGNAGVALSAGLQSVYYNPATIGGLRSYGLQITHTEWLADITYDYLAVSLPALSWASGCLTLTSLDSGEIEVRTVEKPHGTGERYSVNDIAVGVGLGRHITDRFSAGALVSYVQENIWNSSMSTVTLNLGTLYVLSEDGLRIGSSLSNVGDRARFGGRDLALQYDEDPERYGDNSGLPGERFTDEFPLPILFRVGLGYPWQVGPETRLLLEVDTFHPSDNTEGLSGGVELSWRETVALRGGYQNLGQEDSETGVTLGLGLSESIGGAAFQVDYAWMDHQRLEGTHRLTFVLMF